MTNNPQINKFSDLVTTHEARRSGFLEYALRRNKESIPYIDNGKALRTHLLEKTKSCDDILKLDDIRESLLEAAGISDKAKAHLTEDDKTDMLAKFVEKVLAPSGAAYIDEIIYRYLLTLGDALGGRMRNIVGSVAGEKLTRFIVSQLQIRKIDFEYATNSTDFLSAATYKVDVAQDVKAIKWSAGGKNRSVIYNVNVPQVKKNIDIVCLNVLIDATKGKKLKDILVNKDVYVAIGELKGGIDPAGADEHWKTANTALGRVRKIFKNNLPLFFVGAAIETAMAKEIYTQCKSNKLANCANLTNDAQLASLCDWLVVQ